MRSATMPFLPIPRRYISVASVWLVIITLALLNPLTCLIHCAVMDMMSHHNHSQMASDLHFLCDMRMSDEATTVAMASMDHTTMHMQSPVIDQMDASAPQETGAAVPRAVYESLPLTPIAVLLALALVSLIDIRGLTGIPSRSDAPPLPPPRFA